jgi:hypothetical protein
LGDFLLRGGTPNSTCFAGFCSLVTWLVMLIYAAITRRSIASAASSSLQW